MSYRSPMPIDRYLLWFTVLITCLAQPGCSGVTEPEPPPPWIAELALVPDFRVDLPEVFEVGVPSTVTFSILLGACDELHEMIVAEIGLHGRLITTWVRRNNQSGPCQDELLSLEVQTEATFFSTGPAVVAIRGSDGERVRDYQFPTVVALN